MRIISARWKLPSYLYVVEWRLSDRKTDILQPHIDATNFMKISSHQAPSLKIYLHQFIMLYLYSSFHCFPRLLTSFICKPLMTESGHSYNIFIFSLISSPKTSQFAIKCMITWHRKYVWVYKRSDPRSMVILTCLSIEFGRQFPFPSTNWSSSSLP